MVSPREIRTLLVEHGSDLDVAARALVDAANAGGGEDNITVVLFQIAGATTADETREMPVAIPPEPDPEPAQDDEDTLSGLERIPAIDTAVIPPSAVEELQQAEVEPDAGPEQPGPDEKARRRLAPLILLVLLLGAIAVLAIWGLTR
jgi:hypothetical protein